MPKLHLLQFFVKKFQKIRQLHLPNVVFVFGPTVFFTQCFTHCVLAHCAQLTVLSQCVDPMCLLNLVGPNTYSFLTHCILGQVNFLESPNNFY